MTSLTIPKALWLGLSVSGVALVCTLASAQGVEKRIEVRQARPLTGPVTTLAVAFPKTYSKLETNTLYGGYLQHLEACAAVEFVNLRGEPVSRRFDAIDVLSEAELLDNFKRGSLQMAQFTAGLVPVVMAEANAVPFAVRGNTSTRKIHSYHLNLIVRTDSPYRKPVDLLGRTVAHTTPGSNSGNLAPRAFFPELGLRPDTDYKVVYSKGHERSVMGVLHGFYDGAAVASDQFQRLATKGEIRRGSFRVLWESPAFPVEAWALARSAGQPIQDKIVRCTANYRFPANVSKLLEGADAFLPIDAQRDYAPVRLVAERTKGAN